MMAVAGRAARFVPTLKLSSQAINQSRNSALLPVECLIVGSSSKRPYGYKPDPKLYEDTVKPLIPHYKNKRTLAEKEIWQASPPMVDAAFAKPEVFREIRDAVGKGHYDIKMGNFDDVRQKVTLDPTYDAREDIEGKKVFTYMMMGSGVAATGYMVKNVLRGLLGYFGPSADQIAAGVTELELSAIPEGSSLTFKYRGKPLFVKHRTAEQIEAERNADLSTLRDPQRDDERLINPKYLVVIGVCTHLGCVPVHNAGHWGGFYCPCHGSHYDNSGRIRQGPAPLNLEVPPYHYPDPETLVVGS